MLSKARVNQKFILENQECNADTQMYLTEHGWVNVTGLFIFKEPILSIEIGAYTTWFADPSNSVMLHYMTVDDTPVECLYRKEGTEEWIPIELYANKPFPMTDRRVRWFKLEGLESNTTYETKLKYHTNIHRFKTMPSVNTRSLKFIMISDQMNSIESFQTEAPRGFQTMYDNNIDAVLIAGDAVHDNGKLYDGWIEYWNKYFEFERKNNLMLPMVTCLGNHDGGIYNADGTFNSLLWVSSGATKDHVLFHYNFFSNLNDIAYGVIDIGDYFSLIFLDSNHTQPIIGTQTTWLTSVLQERESRQILPFFHISPYPTHYGYGITWNIQIRENWNPLFKQYGVKVVGTGHEHASLVTKKLLIDSVDENGIVYTGQGFGMGNVTRGSNITQDTWYVDYLSTINKSLSMMEFKPSGEVGLKHISLDGDIVYQKTL